MTPSRGRKPTGREARHFSASSMVLTTRPEKVAFLKKASFSLASKFTVGFLVNSPKLTLAWGYLWRSSTPICTALLVPLVRRFRVAPKETIQINSALGGRVFLTPHHLQKSFRFNKDHPLSILMFYIICIIYTKNCKATQSTFSAQRARARHLCRRAGRRCVVRRRARRGCRHRCSRGCRGEPVHAGLFPRGVGGLSYSP